MLSLKERAGISADIVRKAVEEEKFPGAVLAIGNGDGIELLEAWGCAQWIPFRRPMRKDTLFDIASLSKLTGPWPGIMRLLAAGELALDTTIAECLPGRKVHPVTGKATILQLLTHTAGLVPFMNTHGETRDERVDFLLSLPPVSEPGKVPVYSDLSFIFLGEILAARKGEPLEKCAEHFWREIGMNRTWYNPPQDNFFAATEVRAGCPVPQVGEVHDERAAQLGGVAGHAGVFSCAEDLALYCSKIAVPDKCTCLDSEWLKRSYRNHTAAYGGDRCLGWVDYGGSIVGHTGFTGTSIRMDTETGEYGILLTNRVHPSRANDNLWPVRVDLYDKTLFPKTDI